MATQETTIQGMSPEAWFELVASGMKRAVAEEVAKLRREGHPLVVWQDGKVVLLQTKKPKRNAPTRKRRGTRSPHKVAKKSAKPARRR